VTEFNPASVEAAIKVCYERISKGVKICDERYRAFMEADHAYDVAVAQAMVDLDGVAYLKKFKAELATVAERKARDDAKATWRYAESRAEALRDELRALQSVGASVREAYRVVGTGER
jgi:predicted type IV restriction endonuclease